ncbi:Rossmann-fold NAD(P)-binding domain-containing protein [Teichococcus aestuarii]|uniref:NAD(P)-binding domain-containing protein n=1 Tax=Teichococcus aestuarii TaxID=568898 RepID=A0A2U1V7E5_9PROT|nr:hypothetical protein [Pseudoroseomonas aestuarii]PWC29813.1 hypothetical protein CR165_07780 [Pseudoroseomonas aestuarii]
MDKDYPPAVARLARRHGTPAFVLNFSMGADPSSRLFYTRVKGGVERELSALGFCSLTTARPRLISGQRQEPRLAELAVSMILGLPAPVLPRRLQINSATRIVRAMVDAAV